MYIKSKFTAKNIGVIFMFFAVFTAIMPTIRILNLPISDIFIVLSLVYHLANNKIKLRYNYTDYFYALGLFMLLLSYSISSLFSEYTDIVDFIKIILQFSFSFSLFKLIVGSFDERTIDDLILTYINGVVFSSFLILLVVRFFPGFSYKLFKSGVLASHRRFGAFVGPNMLSKIMASIVPLSFLFYLKNRISLKKFLFLMSVIVISLVKSASNGGIISFFVSIVLIILFITNKKTRKNIYIFLTVFLISMILVFKLDFINTDTINNRIINVMSNDGVAELGSYKIKKELMVEGWQKILNNPIIGVGPFSFREISSTGNTIHNSYILTWVEGGLMALFGLMLIILSLFLSILEVKDKTTRIAFQIFLVVFIVNLLTGTDYYQRYRVIPLVLIYESSKFKSK